MRNKKEFIDVAPDDENCPADALMANFRKKIKEAKEKEALRQQRKHDFLIATYGIVGGIISGVASSLIVLYIQGLL